MASFRTGLVLTLFSLAVTACGSAAAPRPTRIVARLTRPAEQRAFPVTAISLAGEGPALFLSAEPSAPAIGYVSAGVPVQVEGEPVRGRALVTIDGPLRAHGWMTVTRLAEPSGHVARPSNAGSVPSRLNRDPARPLLRLAAGTHVLFNGTLIGVLHADAYARGLHTYDNGELDVFVAADDAFALRGMVHASDVASGTPPRSEPTPAPRPSPARPVTTVPGAGET